MTTKYLLAGKQKACYHVDVQKKLRVLMIGWELPPHNSGGLGTACAQMAQALTADGCELKFTLPYITNDYPDGIEVVDCHSESWADFFPEYQNTRPPFSAYSPVIAISDSDDDTPLPPPGSWMEDRVEEYARQVYAYALAHLDEFDLVHAHDWMTIPAAIMIKQKLGKPFVAHFHSTEYDRSGSIDRSTYIGRCETAGMRLADRVLAVSYYTKRVLVEQYQVDPCKIDVVHNGVVRFLQNVSGQEKVFAQGRPVVVFMGRLTMQKGPDYFIRLAEKLMTQRPNILFIVSGMGDMYQHLLLSTASKSLSANLLFSGFVRGGAQQAILRRADVFVMPSVSEPFGLSAAEAAMNHTPVIASKNSGVVEVMTGSPQFDFWDVDAMAAEVLHLLDDHEYRQRVVDDQLSKLDHNTWKKSAHKIEKIYRRVSASEAAKKPRRQVRAKRKGNTTHA
ncbi:glycosyltransferase family 4 protein [bacterium]|nr:glycosyltransferase family 4 protein [bacterium]